jgi:AraC family transcriptional regulator
MSKVVTGTTLGNQLRAVDFHDFNVAEVRYAAGVSLASHAHDFTYLSLVLRGSFEERVGRKVEFARSASVVIMPRGMTHGEDIGPLGARSVTIALKSTFLEEAANGEQPLGQWRWFHSGPVARIMLRIYQEYLLADTQTELGLGESVFELLGTIGGEKELKVSSARPSVAAALELLHARGTEGMRLAALAADLGRDPAYLARAFRQQLGCTMSEYRRRLWVRQAAHLLTSTKAPLSHVALAAGFADQSHLCRVFKAELGTTPQTYRALTGRS